MDFRFFRIKLTPFFTVVISVYKNGFRALFIGRTNTVIHEYTSPDIATPPKANTPETRETLCEHLHAYKVSHGLVEINDRLKFIFSTYVKRLTSI